MVPDIIQCVLLALIALRLYSNSMSAIPWIDQGTISEAVADGIELERERQEEAAQREYDSRP